MKKSQIMELIESYNGEVNCEPLIAQEPYQKGWMKRLLDTRTLGILKLETYLESESVKQLAADDEIEGENLMQLLKIMYRRDQRIHKTSRSYENYPEKSTNRVYNRLYQILLLDSTIQADIGIPFSHTKALHQALFSRIRNKVLANMEDKAKTTYEQEDVPDKGNRGFVRLGLALIFGKRISYHFDHHETPQLEQLTRHVKEINYDEQYARVEFHFLNGELHDAILLDTDIHCDQDIETGLDWLKLASDNGDKNASLHLAAYYARRKNYRLINPTLDPDKTFDLLTLASEQGSSLATRVLDECLSFGMVSIYNLDESSALIP
ncbi:hypothetical protein BN59_01605 [Legionella massiliensis]|uniref:Uncharacterized protein n=1 Tax=Legionella massiliensis TaxID=1034943 RepID=A0A078KWE2_9GAMM|nr:hypothetical protein [Legionella massiliensis]CDZ77322.1 hypothetical protein BN59_01605 [Legionella massiliensis]CEE13060.1 hypothetical protein BN1094_01605 [Legionella massiliensis]